MTIIYGNIVPKEDTYKEFIRLTLHKEKYDPITTSGDFLLQVFSAGVEFAENKLKEMGKLKEI